MTREIKVPHSKETVQEAPQSLFIKNVQKLQRPKHLPL